MPRFEVGELVWDNLLQWKVFVSKEAFFQHGCNEYDDYEVTPEFGNSYFQEGRFLEKLPK